MCGCDSCSLNHFTVAPTDHLDTSGQSLSPRHKHSSNGCHSVKYSCSSLSQQLHITQAPPANTGSINVSTVITRSLRCSSWDSPCACVYVCVCVCCERACVACALDEVVCPTDNPPPIALRSALPPASWPAGGRRRGEGRRGRGSLSGWGGAGENSAHSLASSYRHLRRVASVLRASACKQGQVETSMSLGRGAADARSRRRALEKPRSPSASPYGVTKMRRRYVGRSGHLQRRSQVVLSISASDVVTPGFPKAFRLNQWTRIPKRLVDACKRICFEGDLFGSQSLLFSRLTGGTQTMVLFSLDS